MVFSSDCRLCCSVGLLLIGSVDSCLAVLRSGLILTVRG